jgi:hypothetical protein
MGVVNFFWIVLWCLGWLSPLLRLTPSAPSRPISSSSDSTTPPIQARSNNAFVHRLRNCRVYAGTVIGLVLIDEAEGCVFVMASYQIRIHNVSV